MEKGHRLGLITKQQFDAYSRKKFLVEKEMKRIMTKRLKPAHINPLLKQLGTSLIKESSAIHQLLKRPEVKYHDILRIENNRNSLSEDIISQVEIQTKYKGYIKRQAELAEKFKKMEAKLIPEGFDYRSINGLSAEIMEKLEDIRPLNLGQAGRIPGVTPAAIALLMVAVKK
jgi:tRNA uridine 5-carboxymethylaminomethyl modification enzyme